MYYTQEQQEAKYHTIIPIMQPSDKKCDFWVVNILGNFLLVIVVLWAP